MFKPPWVREQQQHVSSSKEGIDLRLQWVHQRQQHVKQQLWWCHLVLAQANLCQPHLSSDLGDHRLNDLVSLGAAARHQGGACSLGAAAPCRQGMAFHGGSTQQAFDPAGSNHRISLQ